MTAAKLATRLKQLREALKREADAKKQADATAKKDVAAAKLDGPQGLQGLQGLQAQAQAPRGSPAAGAPAAGAQVAGSPVAAAQRLRRLRRCCRRRMQRRRRRRRWRRRRRKLCQRPRIPALNKQTMPHTIHCSVLVRQCESDRHRVAALLSLERNK